MKGLQATCQESVSQSSGKALGNQRLDWTISALMANMRLHKKVDYAGRAYYRPYLAPAAFWICGLLRLEASTKPKVDSRCCARFMTRHRLFAIDKASTIPRATFY